MLARFIALRYAQARSGSALLGFISRVSMAGLVVAVALLITVLAVMNGFEHELRTRILRVVPAITLYPEENEIAEWKVVAQEVLKNPQVTAASPLIEAQGLLVMGSAAEPVLLFATDPVAESKLSHFEEFTDASAWDAWLADPQSVLISRKLANKLGVQALCSTCRPQLIQAGFSTPTFCAPKIERTACISIRLMPQVASSVSSGRP